MKKLIQFSAMLLVLYFVATMTACEKDCKEDTCLNGGTFKECKCQCPPNFSGVNCEIDNTPPPPPTPPIANFSYSPSNIIADVTTVSFSNQSTGSGNSYQWNFGPGEGGSNSNSPTHVFGKEHNNVQVMLTATNSAGSDSSPKVFRVHAMDPDLHHYNNITTYSAGSIYLVRAQNLVFTGNLRIQNNYSGNVIIEVFHPDEWLAGKYTPFANVFWTVATNLPNYNTLLYNGSNLVIGNDWGIRVRFTNGVTSCTRSIFNVATYSGGKFSVKATDIYDGL